MIVCPECGQQLPDGTRFCTNCGQACNRTARKMQQREQMNVAQTIPAAPAATPQQAATQVLPESALPTQAYASAAAQPTQAYGTAQGAQARAQATPGYDSQQPTQYIPPQQQRYADRNTQAAYAQQAAAAATPQPSTGRTAEAFVPAYAPNAAQQASAAAAAAGGTAQQEKRQRNIIIAAAIAAVLIVAVVAVAAWTSRANQQAAYDADHAGRHVTFSLDAPGYNEKSDSPIPVRISGSNLDGVQVDQVYYITPKNATIDLQQGSYTASVAASPLLSSGTLYQVPAELIDVQIRENDLHGGDLVWTFAEMQPIDLTDDMIQDAYRNAVESGMDQAKAEALRDGVLDARQAALDKQAASAQAEADRVAAAEERAHQQAQASARNYDDGYVALDVPSTWFGNYTATPYGHTSGAFHTDFYLNGSSFVLLRIDGVQGDLSSYTATYTNAATEIWDNAHGAGSYYDSDLDLALYLQTGGAISRADVLACPDGYSAQALGEQYIGYFMDANIAPTVTTSSW